MPVDPKLQDLMDRWEDLHEQGQEVSAERLCRDHPELLEPLKRRIKALKAMAWLLDSDSSSDENLPDVGCDLPPLPRTLGRYRLDELVGTGGFGQVWKGYDPGLDRIVAIKVPRPDRIAADQADTFIEEARKVARLRHPGIVPVHDVGRDGNYCFIVSDFVEGGNLAEMLKRGRPDWQESARLIGDVADILDHAHQQGFIHRDIKPANILLDHRGQPYLTDFGIAATKEELAAAGGPSIGTLAYMSPEQVGGQPVDPRSDVFSLGVVLFAMLAGERPFSATSSGGLRDQIRSSPPLEDKLAAGPLELKQICLKCLAKNPDERYASASGLADALRDLIHQPRPANRRRWLVAVATLLTLIIAAVAITAGFLLAGKNTVAPEEPSPALSPKKSPAVSPLGDADKAQLLIAKGTSLCESNNFQEAAAVFTQAIEQAPQLAECYHRRGICQFNLGEMQKATDDFSQAIQQEPQNADSRRYRAMAWLRLKEFDKAMDDAAEALKLDPAHADAHTSVLVMGILGRASQHNDRHEWKQSIDDLNEAIRLEPRNAKAFHRRGIVYHNIQEFDRAIDDFTQAIFINPDDPAFYLHRSYSRRGKGQTDEADADMEKAQSLQGKAKPETGTP